MPAFNHSSARRGFTLLELLIAIAIISLLIGLALPTLGKARARSKLTACGSNLRQVSIGLRSYMSDNGDILPYASFMPSIDPLPLSSADSIFIADVLKPHLGDQGEVFRCPNDSDGASRPAPNENKTYYESEKSSYEYRARYGGETMAGVVERFRNSRNETYSDSTIWLFRDYENFHGPGGTPDSRRYVYLDGHVTDYEN